ncbi:uncharacterized protein EAE97_005686 [Botrytis byssoidea]|uniref:Uncharacterized protein n=1 Tax=Botrytis byssoidea TaxID=139641 RepID=A0A9P5M6N8_9HELO|nr:uncharacterized protein EAE97_005686 [Botrytis byssoidea]KAF7943615.1 hypothetical protein EAE97_005686 [Botrytis byssoidea]
MGRISKFSFPIPGRKRSSSREQAYQVPPPPSKISSGNLSKAEEILGTGTIDSGDWRRPGSRSSRISISISESTHSTVQDGNDYDQWDGESGVFPRQTNLRGQASSNALGQRFGEDMATETSSTTHRLRNENSTSTLKSYYDRQKLPAAISQQTSASSARDMALRKGLTPVVSRSPLLEVDSVDPWDQAGQSPSSMNDNHLGSPERKKSVRAGISSLFHRSERRPSVASQNSYDSSKQNTSLRNRLVKAASKESLQSQRQNILSTKSRDQREQKQNYANPDDSHDYYEQSTRNAHMKAIPESNVPETFNLFPSTSENSNSRQPGSLNSEKREGHRRLEDLHSSSGEKEAFSWKNVRSNKNGNFRNSMISQSTGHSSLGISSTGSISSHNTKTSRQTGGSVFSSADLQQSSVLSLSSDSEEDLSDTEPSKSRDNISIGKAPSHAESEIIPPALQSRLSTTKNLSRRPSAMKTSPSTRKTSQQSNAFLTIPEPNGGLSKWPMPPSITRQDSINSQESGPTSSLKPKKYIPPPPPQQQQPTPPLSPKEIDAETDSTHTASSGRMMQVTQQEEALLEALRQKRARMREKILEEHRAEGGVSRSPPRSTGNRASSRFSKASTASTIRPGTEKVPLILDAPIMKGKEMGFGGRYGIGSEYGQPSPDLSDFLSMGSEEFEDDETPTNSRGVSRNEVRGNGNGIGSTIDVPQFKRPGTPPQHDPRFTSLVVEKGSRNEDQMKRNPSMGKVRFVG